MKRGARAVRERRRQARLSCSHAMRHVRTSALYDLLKIGVNPARRHLAAPASTPEVPAFPGSGAGLTAIRACATCTSPLRRAASSADMSSRIAFDPAACSASLRPPGEPGPDDGRTDSRRGLACHVPADHRQDVSRLGFRDRRHPDCSCRLRRPGRARGPESLPVAGWTFISDASATQPGGAKAKAHAGIRSRLWCSGPVVKAWGWCRGAPRPRDRQGRPAPGPERADVPGRASRPG